MAGPRAGRRGGGPGGVRGRGGVAESEEGVSGEGGARAAERSGSEMGGRRAAAAAVAVGALGLLGGARACWFWQTDWSTACECERPCWCLVPDEPVTPGPYQGHLDDYYLCDNCPCRTEGLFNPGDGPVLGDPGWPFPGQEDTSPAVADGEEDVPVIEDDVSQAVGNETSEAVADEEDDLTVEDVTDAIDNAVENAIDEVADTFWEGIMAWESPIFS